MAFSFTNAYRRGWRLFKARYLALLGASAVFLLASAAVDIAMSAIESPLLDLLVAVFFYGPFTAGMQLFALAHLRDSSHKESRDETRDESSHDRPTLRILLAGFSSRYLPLVAIHAVLSMVLVACALLAVGAWAVGGGGAIGLLVAVAIMLLCAVLSVRLLFASLLCIDPQRNLGVTASLAESWRLTRACFWALLGVLLTVMLIVIATAALLFLPLLFFGFPLIIAVFAAAYQSIVSEAERASQLDEDLLA